MKKLLTLFLSGAIVFGSSSADALSLARPENGVYSIQPKCAPGAELSTLGQRKTNGINVLLAPISNNNVKWRLTRLNNDDWYSITVEGAGNIGLNVDNGRSDNGTNITLWEVKGEWQHFRIWDMGGGYYLIQPHVGQRVVLLDVAGGGNNTSANVWCYGQNNSAAQLWKLVKVTNNRGAMGSGDINGDGKVDQTDLKLLENLVLNDSYNPAGDMNGDGSLTIVDVSRLALKINGKPTPKPQEQKGYINTQSLNLNFRSNPNGSIIGKLAKNTPITIIQGDSNGWTKIRTNSGQVGYVSSQYVAYGDPPSPIVNTETPGYVNTESKNLNFRSSPNGSVIGKLARHERVTILQKNSNGWTKIRNSSGQEGYASSQYIAEGEPPIPPPIDNDIQNHLERLANNTAGYRMGTKYTGSGECRGFANKVYLATFQGVSYISGYANYNYSASSFSGSYEAGRLFNFSSNDTAAVKRLFQSVKVGAFVQMGRRGRLNSTKTAASPHSAIVYNIMEDGVQFFEANTDGKNTIKVGTYSWHDLANKNQGFTIYMPNNYSLK
ncbi:MAG: SH3 domain-containing protein [Selenomonadaceae bacterium]|nr:SH3 domain-containing protein [Selenomonadaceae bacterium]